MAKSKPEKKKPIKCPKCGAAEIVPLVFGYPLPETEKKAGRREIALGGCCCWGDERDNNAFLYMPNFCIAETFSVFMKHRYSGWNRHVKKRLSSKDYLSAVEAFQKDIHNGRVIYHYEVNRYHILGINLVAPVDHYYQMMRPNRLKAGQPRKPSPAGTFDQLIVSMGVQLTHLHGAPNTIVVTADRRLADLINKCKKPIKQNVRRKLGLDHCEGIVGRTFQPETFPNVIDIQRASRADAEDYVGCQLPVKRAEIRERRPKSFPL